MYLFRYLVRVYLVIRANGISTKFECGVDTNGAITDHWQTDLSPSLPSWCVADNFVSFNVLSDLKNLISRWVWGISNSFTRNREMKGLSSNIVSDMANGSNIDSVVAQLKIVVAQPENQT